MSNFNLFHKVEKIIIMDTHLKQICRLCFETDAKLVNVFENFEDSTIASVLAQHFWFEVSKNDGMSESVCETCWINVNTFHSFYKRVEWLHENHSANLITTKMDPSFAVIQQGQSGSTSSVPDLNIVKCEDTDLLFEITDMQMKNEENIDNDGEDDCNNWEQIEIVSHSSESSSDDRFSNKIQKIDGSGVKDESLMTDIDCKSCNVEDITSIQSNDVNERAIQDSQIREYFTLECNICNDVVKFETFKEFKQHYRRIHNLNGRLKCCGLILIQRSDVLTHIHLNHLNTDADIAKQNALIREFVTLRCNICSGEVKLDTFKEFKKHHSKVHKSNGILECCGIKLFQRSDVLRHIYDRHLNPDAVQDAQDRAVQDAQIREFFNLKCDMCSGDDFNFDTIEDFRKHYRQSHNKEGYLRCCGRKFELRNKVLQHVHYHLNPDEYRCDSCDKQFCDLSTLKTHLEAHSSIRTYAYKCDQCTKSYMTVKLLKQHMEYKHLSKDGETFSCEKCGKHYPTEKSLKCHIRSAHTSPIFICDICARIFKTSTNLLNHMELLHSTKSQPKAQCKVCGIWLKHAIGLQKHLRLQHHQQNVNCPICNKVLKNRYSLTAHIRNNHREIQRRHQCTLCDKLFRSAKLLKEHIATHTGENLYDCGYCDKKFKSSANLCSHRKKSHFIEWSRERCRRTESLKNE